MRCSQITTYLKEYHNGTLDAALTEQVTIHLAGCKDCAGELAFMQSYLTLTQKIPAQKAPSHFTDQVRQKIAASESSSPTAKLRAPLDEFFRKRLVPLPVPVITLASILLVITFVIVLNKPFQLAQDKEARQLKSAALSMSSAETGAKSPVDDAGSTNQNQDKQKAAGEPNRTQMRANVLSGAGVIQLPKLTLLIKPVASDAKKEELSMELPPVSGRIGGNEKGDTISGASGTQKSAADEPAVNNTAQAQTGLTPVIEHIRAISEGLNGKLTISTSNQPGTGSATELIIILPAQNYQNFLAAVSKYGELKKPYPVLEAKGRETVEITLELLAP